ncbi:sugar-binding domain-containing protein [Nocardiopsis rhodophaea]
MSEATGRASPGGESAPGNADAAPARGPAELVQVAAIARRFYLDSRSKVEIAKEFGLSRFKVARALETARDTGIVRIDIRLPAQLDAERSDRLREAFGLHHAIVVAESGDPVQTRRQIGTVAADLLSEIVTADDILGLTSGRTLEIMCAELDRLAPCTIVQLNGVISDHPNATGPVETVRRAAHISGGSAYPIYAPLVLPDAATARTLRADPGIAAAFAHFERLTKAVVAIGGWDEQTSTVYQALGPDERARYAEMGVRADMSAQLFNTKGEQVRTHLDDRVLSVRAEQLRRVPEVIAVAGGAAKAGAIGIMLRTGLISSLVTDAAVARVLLAE